MHLHEPHHQPQQLQSLAVSALRPSRNTAHPIARPHVRVPFFSKQGRRPQRAPSAMSVQDVIEQTAPQTDAKPVKPRKISPRVRHAIELLVSGDCRTQKDAAEKANLTRERLCKALKEVHVITYLEQQTRVALARSQAPAAATLIRLLDQAASEHVQKDVAIHLLNIAGHKPRADAQVAVNIEIKAGYVIDISPEPKRPPMIDVTRD